MKVCPPRPIPCPTSNCLPRSAHAVRVGSNRADERGPRAAARPGLQRRQRQWHPAGACRALRGRAESYMRHIAYADPHGAFTIAYLVWRQGQFSPCMAKAWCTYRVLQGRAVRNPLPLGRGGIRRHCCGGTTRRPGVVTATQGPDPQAEQRRSRSRHLAAHLRRRSGRYLQRRESSDRQGAGRVAQALIPPNAFLARRRSCRLAHARKAPRPSRTFPPSPMSAHHPIH